MAYGYFSLETSLYADTGQI